MTRIGLLPSALAAALIFAGGSTRAEVQKFIAPCGGQRLCMSYQLALTPPPGWTLDTKASSENKVQIIVPQGRNFANAEALIYVQVFYHRDKTQSLADFAGASNEQWLAANKGAKISALAPVARDNGKEGFLRFAFDNPGKPQQAYEIGAFGLDNDKDGNEFVLDVVMTGAAKKALQRADSDYLAFLKTH